MFFNVLAAAKLASDEGIDRASKKPVRVEASSPDRVTGGIPIVCYVKNPFKREKALLGAVCMCAHFHTFVPALASFFL